MKAKKQVHQCAALDEKAKQCRRTDTKPKHYHGDGEIYDYLGPMPVLVKVYLCLEHRGEK